MGQLESAKRERYCPKSEATKLRRWVQIPPSPLRALDGGKPTAQTASYVRYGAIAKG